MSNSFDKLFEVLKIRYKNQEDPERSAYVYITHYAKHCIPEKDLLFAIEHVEKEIIMDTLKA